MPDMGPGRGSGVVGSGRQRGREQGRWTWPSVVVGLGSDRAGAPPGRGAPLGAGDPEWVGPCRVLGRLGAGGMGTVFLARADGGEPVAVKVLRPELAGDPTFLRMFRHEVAAARRVVGFCTAQVLDADTSGPLPYLVTEYVEG